MWAQVVAHRGANHHPPEPSRAAVAAVHRLITAFADTDTSPLRSALAWPAAFQHAGRDLADLARQGSLTRGLRAVPRHLFLPGVDLKAAYKPQVVVTKRAEDGTAISSASHPNLVASMLEQLDVQPGHWVLEIGAATGINAALLAELVGPTGTVVTREIDDDLAAAARAGLAAAGYHQVEVICADGYPAGAPYDRIIVTAGAWDLASAWWQQLVVGGRIVVPLRLHSSGLTRSIGFDLTQPGRMVSSSAQVCGFVPLRGATAHAERSLQLTDDVVLHLDAADIEDEAALGQALSYPAHEHCTGVTIGDHEPVEHLDLWLATTSSRFSPDSP